ncbi:MAG TPA: polysaccharide deacetylase family protein, partial [Acidimicrobiia bacterium]|nr:polysaccharide deacetylase family protein [Acidimicrobiia bacterium]
MGGFGMGTGRRWLCILLVPVALAGATDAGAAIDDTGTILADDDGTPEFPRVRVPAFLESSRRVTDTYGDKPNIFLTYDDGSSVYTQRLLDVLAPYDDISVTFFVMCREAVPGTMQRILDDGHALGNHTCGHPILTSLSTASRLRQWQRLEDFVNARVEPDVDLTCQRPPFGATSRSVRADAESMGMREWGWSVDPWDWSGASVSRILAALESMDDGDIIILHDSAGSYRTVEATRIFLQRHADDYIFRSLPDCTLGRPLVWEGRFWDDDGSIFEEDIEW